MQHHLRQGSSATSYIKSGDGDLDSLMLAACLTALGIPFDERAGFKLTGDTQPVVNWLFESESQDKKFNTSEMIAKWDDTSWIQAPNNEHPLAYLSAAMRNLKTLIHHHIGNAPKIELVKRGNKTLLVPEGSPESQLGILLKQFTK